MAESDVSLELATLGQIGDELQRRFDGYILVIDQSRISKRDDLTVYWRGSYALALGMLEYGKIRIAKNIDSEMFGEEHNADE